MTAIDIGWAAAPRLEGTIRAKWAPIYFHPIRGSEERLVIGVAVVGGPETTPHIETANALERLQCLYGPQSDILIQAARVASAELLVDMEQRSTAALLEYHPVISGVELGPVREAVGFSLEAIGASWMSTMSSLYDIDGDRGLLLEDMLSDEELVRRGALGGERLPRLVLAYLMQKDLNLARFFRPDLVAGSDARRRTHEVIIDYSGPRVVANFGTIKVGRITQSVDLIKRRLWDLKVDRDNAHNQQSRRHEMLVQMPSSNDPQVSERQLENLRVARQALEDQANQEELRLEAFTNVEDIGERLLQAEAA